MKVQSFLANYDNLGVDSETHDGVSPLEIAATS